MKRWDIRINFKNLSLKYRNRWNYYMAKPFVKWAGGKSQLLAAIRHMYPAELGQRINRYCEPFVGGGAVLFDILNRYAVDEVYINDVNEELINTYKIIQSDVQQLIGLLEIMQDEFSPLETEERREYYAEKRHLFNRLKTEGKEETALTRAALLLFLNKTCFNGLYRVNGSGLFNVPIGAYKNPLICDKDNLLQVHHALRQVSIHCGDYARCMDFINNETFVYIDPPYRPLSATSSFKSYNASDFNDGEQIRLADFVKRLDSMGAKIIVSNSDPKNTDATDSFFDDLYEPLSITTPKE